MISCVCLYTPSLYHWPAYVNLRNVSYKSQVRRPTGFYFWKWQLFLRMHDHKQIIKWLDKWRSVFAPCWYFDHRKQTKSSTFRFFSYNDIFPILTFTSMTCSIVTKRRVWLVNGGCSLLLGTLSYLYLCRGLCWSVLNLYFDLWIFEMVESLLLSFSKIVFFLYLESCLLHVVNASLNWISERLSMDS